MSVNEKLRNTAVTSALASTCASEKQKRAFITDVMKLTTAVTDQTFEANIRVISERHAISNQRHELNRWYRKIGVTDKVAIALHNDLNVTIEETHTPPRYDTESSHIFHFEVNDGAKKNFYANKRGMLALRDHLNSLPL